MMLHPCDALLLPAAGRMAIIEKWVGLRPERAAVLQRNRGDTIKVPDFLVVTPSLCLQQGV